MRRIKSLDRSKIKVNQLLVLSLCTLSGIIYNSWPFGYLLDKSTARYGLASDLEKIGHPYYWLFIAGDVISSVLVIFAAYIIHLEHPKKFSRYYQYVWLGLIIFGIFTIVASYLPSECNITPILRCHLIDHKGLGIDALTSTIAALGIFMSLIAIRTLSLKNRLPSFLHLITQSISILWLISGIGFIFFSLLNINTHLIQQILISLSGLSIALVGINIYLLLISNSSEENELQTAKV